MASFGPHLDQFLNDPYNQFSAGTVDALIRSAPQTGENFRNTAFGALLAQLGGPSFANLYATGGADSAAQTRSRSTKQARGGLEKRGLAQSGLALDTQRGIEGQYGAGLAGATAQGQDLETKRRMALLQQLLGVGGADLGFESALGNAGLNVRGASRADNLADLANQFMLAKGSAELLATVVAAGAGAGGALGGGAGAGAGAAGASGAAGAYGTTPAFETAMAGGGSTAAGNLGAAGFGAGAGGGYSLYPGWMQGAFNEGGWQGGLAGAYLGSQWGQQQQPQNLYFQPGFANG